MFPFYKEKKWIISFFILLLDGIITYYSDITFNNLNYFYPMLTISFLPFLDNHYPLRYYRECFIIGFVYDLLYSNIFLYHAVIFMLIGAINHRILKKLKNNLLLFILLVIIDILLYDSINYLLVFATNYHIVSLNDLYYKIIHSLLLNIMSCFVYFFMFKRRSI